MRSRLVIVALWALCLVISPARAQGEVHLGLKVGPAEDGGVSVQDVAPDSPAAKAGLKKGDVILRLDDQPVEEVKAFIETIARRKTGDKVTLQIRREGKEQKITATLAERPAARERPGEERQGFLGINVQELTEDLKKQLGVEADKGVVVTEVMPNSPAAKAGLRQDDVITSVDGKGVADAEDLRATIGAAGAGKEVTLKVVRGKETMEIKTKLERRAAGPFPPGFPPGFRPPVDVPPIFEGGRRIQELERRIDELEKRIRDLEKRK